MKNTVRTTMCTGVINNVKQHFLDGLPPPPGVRQMRLCLREWKRKPGATEDAGELHLQLPECSAGDEGLVPSSATGYRGV